MELRHAELPIQNQGRWTWLIASIWISTGVVGLRLVNDSYLWNLLQARTITSPIGTAARVEGSARQKSQGSLIWMDLTSEALPVADGDSVFTADRSTARVEIQGLGTAEIQPNSLVILRGPNRLIHGEGWFSSFMKSFVGVTQMSKVEVEQGSVKIWRNPLEPPTLLKAGETAESPGDAFNPIFPAEGATVHSTSDKKVELRWEIAPGPDSPKAIEIRSNKSVQRFDVASGETSISVGLQPGEYDWRADVAGAGWKKFKISELTAPQARGPINGFERSVGTIQLGWEKLESGTIGEIELTTPAGKIMMQSSGDGVVTQVQPGQYKWRARTKSRASQAVSPWSQSRTFHIRAQSAEVNAAQASAGILSTQSKPASHAPEKRIVLLPTLELDDGAGSNRIRKDLKLNEIPVMLRWAAVPGVKSYLLEVKDSTGKVIEESETRKPESKFTIRSLAQGEYQYKVSAQLTADASIESQWAAIEIAVLPPRPTLPLPQAILTVGRSTLLVWEKTCLTEFYRIQVAKDPQFNQIVSEHTTRLNSHPFKPQSSETLYWRVRSSTRDRESDWTKPRILNVR